MKKEQLFDAIGEIRDDILDRYLHMDIQLARKHARKRTLLRVFAIAACLALLIGVCVPVGMMIAQIAGQPSPDPGPVGTGEEQSTLDPAQTAGSSDEVTTGDPSEATTDDTGESTTDDPGTITPPEPRLSISVRSMEALAQMREMISCEDEELLQEYLYSIEGDGTKTRQDLIEFVNLADNVMFAPIINGEIIALSRIILEGSNSLYVAIQATNGDSISYNYLWSDDTNERIQSIVESLGDDNLLTDPVTSGDGLLVLYAEKRTVQALAPGNTIQWWGTLDGAFIEISYSVADAQAISTPALIGLIMVDRSVTATPPEFAPDITYAWENTVYGAFLDAPEMHVYAVGNGNAPIFEGLEVDLPLNFDAYIDETAPRTAIATFNDREYPVTYIHSLPQSLRRQAVHCYEGQSEEGTFTAMFDQETGCWVSFLIHYNKIEVYHGGLSNTQKIDKALQYARKLANHDYYSGLSWTEGDYTVYQVFRRGKNCITNEAVYLTYHTESFTLVGQERAYYRAMNYLDRVNIPNNLMNAIKQVTTSLVPGSEMVAYPIIVLPDGRLAMNCVLQITYFDELLQQETEDSVSLLFYLTEPIK